MKRVCLLIVCVVSGFFGPLLVREAQGHRHPLDFWIVVVVQFVVMLAGGLWLGQRIRRRRGLPPLRR